MFRSDSIIAKKILLEEDIILNDFKGWFELSGIGFSTTKTFNEWNDDDAQVMTLILNGISFSFIEDPNDGYRSTLDRVIVGEFQEIENTFPSIRVYFTCIDDNHENILYGGIDKDRVIENSLIRIGTDNADDYYPTFISEWHPEVLGERVNGL